MVMAPAAAILSNVFLFPAGLPISCCRSQSTIPSRLQAQVNTAAAAVSAFLLKEKYWYEHSPGCSDATDDAHHQRSADRTKFEQRVSATAGSAAAESGSNQPGRSFAIRGAAGAVQRT